MRGHPGNSSAPRTRYATCPERRERPGTCRTCRIRDICDAQRWNEPPRSTTYVVEVGSISGDLPELMADMRMWLDHRHIEVKQFDELHHGRTVALVVGFRAAGDAAAFAEAFRGALRFAGLARRAS